MEEEIKMVKDDILRRFPNCSYTITVLLWDDETRSVECRHGNDEGDKIYISTYYDNELTYKEVDIDGMVMIRDEFGMDKFMYLTDKIQ